MPWTDEYLDELRKDHTLCLPRLDLAALADRLQIPLKTLKVRRDRNQALKAAEREIVALHVGRLKAEASVAGRPVLTGEDEDLPAHLERYLELYTDPGNEDTYDQRFRSLRALQDEGVPVEWADIVQAMEDHPAFKEAMDAHWKEGHVEVVDTLRIDARKGKGSARRMYLQAEMPEKFGNRLKVEVDHRHQLDDEDRRLVEGIKGKIEAPRRRQPSPDVVEGEFEVVS